MQPLHVVILQSDSQAAQTIVSALASSSTFLVHQVQSLPELRASVAKHRAGIAILDMEAASISDVEHLCREFPAASIVCTHRLADDNLWTTALNAGATDVCPPSDIRGILRAARTNGAFTKSAVA
jgi:hypothetical protein